MSDARIHLRCAFLSFVLIAFATAGCAPGLHSVRLRMADGQERATLPRPRPALAVADVDVQRATASLARKVVPVADPLEFASQLFGVPMRGGALAFNLRTRQLTRLDDPTAAETLAPEMAEQVRDYLQWCQNNHQPGDCLRVLRNGSVLDSYGRYAVAMAIAQRRTFEAMKASLKDMANPEAVVAMLVSGMTLYMMLWVLPEPVSKGIAAAMTMILVAYLGVDTLYTLGRGWKRLVDRADAATTFDQLHDAGAEFANVMGADTARILVMVATAAVGSGAAGMAKVAPTLPGAFEASRLAVAEGSVEMATVGAVETVTVGESGLTVALAPGVLAMSNAPDDSGAGREADTSEASRQTVKAGPTEEPAAARKIVIDPRQLQAKFKHAPDFGVAGNYNKANAAEFGRAIEQHIQNPAVRAIRGTYRREPVVHYLDSSTGLNVMTDLAGNFISGWRLSAEQLRNVLAHGGL